MFEPAPRLPRELLKNCRVVPDRTEMLEDLPKGGTYAEVGVALGDFSRLMIDTCRPDRFLAIDNYTMHEHPHAWGGEVGRRFGKLDHETFFRQRFAPEIAAGRVTIHAGDSVQVLAGLPDRSLDLCYLDADHRYPAVSAELQVVKHKMAPGGIIVLNDYVGFDPYVQHAYGVPRAAHEFMLAEGWEAILMALEPRLFFDLAIRKLG
jgi:hypothetical protein